MRPPEQIKQGLECCLSTRAGLCKVCPYNNLPSVLDADRCGEILRDDVIEYIKQLETEREELMDKVDELEEG